jgi:hypothetical protein
VILFIFKSLYILKVLYQLTPLSGLISILTISAGSGPLVRLPTENAASLKLSPVYLFEILLMGPEVSATVQLLAP